MFYTDNPEKTSHHFLIKDSWKLECPFEHPEIQGWAKCSEDVNRRLVGQAGGMSGLLNSAEREADQQRPVDIAPKRTEESSGCVMVCCSRKRKADAENAVKCWENSSRTENGEQSPMISVIDWRI